MNDIKEMAWEIKQYAPHVSVIAGGMLVKKVLNAGEGFSKRTLGFLSGFHGKVDAFVVEAKGEQTLVRLLEALKQGRDISAVPNLAYFDGKGHMVFTSRQEEEIQMDQMTISWNNIQRKYLRSTLPLNRSRG